MESRGDKNDNRVLVSIGQDNNILYLLIYGLYNFYTNYIMLFR